MSNPTHASTYAKAATAEDRAVRRHPGHVVLLARPVDQDGLTQKELSDLVGTMEPTTLSAIASMEQRGIVARVRNAADKRKINIFLTLTVTS
ncbi:hypothetical protein CJD35_19390 (plasmid) [Sphingobium xenophagum]|uniref:HTH marR-type domain-containing protein n=1 Tax=Sphingobium xenophagum TaxID=121428 RepID=A0A249MZQ4_SPHXE|nr:hypothetical protein CJD35_19390 [Sphingobium xenophagum]